MGVMMRKKLRERRMVFQFRRAMRTQCQENFSRSTSEVEVAPWASSFMRWVATYRSSSVKNLAWPGEWGMKNMAAIPTTMVMAPSRKKMNGL
jgi:hypothetical protein